MSKKIDMHLLLILALIFSSNLQAIEKPETDLTLSAIKTKLGTQLNMDLEFQNSEDQSQKLSEIINSKPSIIVPAYFGCPRLCGLVLDGVAKLANNLNLELGKDYQIISVSFDERDKAKNAAKFQEKFRNKLNFSDDIKNGWRFYVGSKENVSALMSSLGFGYLKDKGEFAHSAAIYLVSPEGRISQYFTGISYSPWDTKLALIDAAKGAIGSAIDHVLLFCFRFDESKGKYTWAAVNLMRLGGALTLLLLVGLFINLKLKEKNRTK